MDASTNRNTTPQLVGIVILTTIISAIICSLIQYAFLGTINRAITFAVVVITALGITRHAALTRDKEQD
jgi:predicted secreted protein